MIFYFFFSVRSYFPVLFHVMNWFPFTFTQVQQILQFTTDTFTFTVDTFLLYLYTVYKRYHQNTFFFTIPTFLLTQLQQISICLHFATDMFIFTIDTLLFMIYDTYLYIYTVYSPAGSPRIRGHTSFCRRTADTCCSYTSGNHCETL